MQEQGRCQFVPGKVLTRKCPGKATAKCVRCNRDMCSEHSMPTSAGVLCIECTAQKSVTDFPGESIYTDEEMALFDRTYTLWAQEATKMYDQIGLREDQFDAS